MLHDAKVQRVGWKEENREVQGSQVRGRGGTDMRETDKDREAEINPYVTYMVTLLSTRISRPYNEKRSFQQVMLGKLDIYMQKNEVRPLPYTLYKN